MTYYIEEQPFDTPLSGYTVVSEGHQNYAEADEIAQKLSRKNQSVVQLCQVDGCKKGEDSVRCMYVKGNVTFFSD